MGNGAGLTPRSLGETGGEAAVTLLTSELPLHTHTANANIPGNSADPGNTAVWGNPGGRPSPNFYSNVNPQALSLTGGSAPHNNMMPYLVVNFCIAMQGVFPARN